MIIALVQLAAAFGYLLYVMRFSARILPLIVRCVKSGVKDIYTLVDLP